MCMRGRELAVFPASICTLRKDLGFQDPGKVSHQAKRKCRFRNRHYRIRLAQGCHNHRPIQSQLVQGGLDQLQSHTCTWHLGRL